MIYLYIGLAFLAGALVAGYCCARYFSKKEAGNPLSHPRTDAERRLAEAAHRQLNRWDRGEYERLPQSAETLHDLFSAMGHFARNGEVWTAKDGVVTLPNGMEIPVEALARTLPDLLANSYEAVRRMADLLADCGGYLPADSEVLGEIRHLVEGNKYVFEPVVMQLARSLGHEDECYKFALDLWDRNLAWMNTEHREFGELERACQALGIAHPRYDDAAFRPVVDRLLFLAHYTKNERLREGCEHLLFRWSAKETA